MSLLFWLLSGELILLTVSISLGLFIANKRREHRLHEAVSKLLQAILDSEAGHQEQIRNELLTRYPLSGKKKIEQLGNQIIAEERVFFHELVRVLLTGDTKSLSTLHQPLHALLNRQMDILHQLGTGGGKASADDLQTDTVGEEDDMGIVSASASSAGLEDEADDGDDDDLDALLQAASLAEEDSDQPEWVESTGEEEMDAGLTAASTPGQEPAAADDAEAGAEDDELEVDEEMDALLKALEVAVDYDEDSELLVAGGDDSESMEMSEVPPANPPEAAPADERAELDSAADEDEAPEDADSAMEEDTVMAMAQPPKAATGLTLDEGSAGDEDMEDIDALLQAINMAATQDEDADLFDGGDAGETMGMGSDDDLALMEDMPLPEEPPAQNTSGGEVLDASALKALSQETPPAREKKAATATPRASRTKKAAEPPPPPQAAAEDEFDALLSDLAKMEATPPDTTEDTGMDGDQTDLTEPQAIITGLEDEDMGLDIEDILNDLLLAEDEDDAAAKPAAPKGKPAS